MRRIAFIVFAFLVVHTVHSQNMYVHEQYVFERFLLNPAFTGLREGSSIRLTHRQQWTGIAEGPKTSFLSFNSRMGSQPIGIGGYIANDLNGPEQKIGFQLTFAYHLILTAKRFDQTVLSMAMSFNGQYHILDETAFNPDIYDPLITYTRQSSFLPDFNAGIMLSRNKYMFGVSVDHLIPSYDKLYNREIESLSPMYTHFHGAYVFGLSRGIDLKTFVNVRTDFKAHNQMEVMVRASYAYGKKIQSAYMRNPNEFYVGFCYRHTLDYLNSAPLSLQPTFGVKIGAFTFAYLYDMGLTAIQLYNYGSHQLSIGLFLVGDKTLNVGRNRVPIINTDF